MKQYTFKFGKLVRDNILDFLQKDGADVDYNILEKDEFVISLKNKLVEESDELCKASERDEFVEELADIQEIIDTLCCALDISKKEVGKYQVKKRKKRGSFDKKVYIKAVTCTEDYSWFNYFLENKDKYPQVEGNSNEELG